MWELLDTIMLGVALTSAVLMLLMLIVLGVAVGYVLYYTFIEVKDRNATETPDPPRGYRPHRG